MRIAVKPGAGSHGENARCVALELPGLPPAPTRRGGKPRLSHLLLVRRADGTACIAALRASCRLDDDALAVQARSAAELIDDPARADARLALADARAIETFFRRRPHCAEALAAFDASLDGATIAVAPRKVPARYATYSWLVRQPAIERERIAQAARAYPFLWTLVHPASATGDELLARIRDARPIADTICTMLEARPWQARLLRDACAAGHLTEDELVHASDLVALVRGLDALPPEHAPRTRAGWLYLRRLVASLPHKAWIRDLSDVGLDLLAAGRGVPRPWRGFARLTGLRRQLSDIRDFYSYASDFADQQWLPRDHDRSLRRVIEAQARWKAVVDPQPVGDAANDASLDALPAHLSGRWRPLTAAPVRVGSAVFHELASLDALREEGFLMKHCIASYARICEEKGSRVFSVRDAAGERVSTLQILRLKGTWRVLQHRGKANAPVPAHYLRLAEAFVRTLDPAPASSATVVVRFG